MAKDKPWEDPEWVPEVHIGHPNDPHRGELRTVEDEKSVDAQGEKVVEGLPWSLAKTDLWLFIAVSGPSYSLDRPIRGMSYTQVPGGSHYITVGATLGRPKANIDHWGACIELPSDLASDKIKRTYMAEWIAETTVEALSGAGYDFKEQTKQGYGSRNSQVGLWVSMAAEDAIRAAGL